LAYLHVLVIFSLIFSKNKPFVRFHAKQGLLLLAFVTFGLFALYIPILSWIVVVFYAIFLLAGIINVFLGRERHLPVIGVLAEKI
jgi:fumarate reductase subunit D